MLIIGQSAPPYCRLRRFQGLVHHTIEAQCGNFQGTHDRLGG